MSLANNKRTTNSNKVDDNKENENKTTDTSEEEAEEEEDSEDSDYSEASLTSEKIIIASKEKRLQQRIMGLQASIENLKKQLRTEKAKWKQNMKELQEMQQKNNQDHIRYQHYCGNRHTPSDLSLTMAESTSSLFHNNLPDRKCEQFVRRRSIKQLLEIEEYKRKLNETENMCNIELLRVKRSLADLLNLQSIASEWALSDESNRNGENKGALSAAGTDGGVQDIFVSNQR